MYPVLHHSLQYLPEVDHQAMAVFLMGDQPPAPATIATRPLAELTASAQAGRQEYLNLCAGCHGAQGQGIPTWRWPWPATPPCARRIRATSCG